MDCRRSATLLPSDLSHPADIAPGPTQKLRRLLSVEGPSAFRGDIMNRMEFSRTVRVPFSRCNGDFIDPAHAAFGGCKDSGTGRESHKMMLGHYQRTRTMLVSHSPKKLGFFF
jgi:hypothetical protein